MKTPVSTTQWKIVFAAKLIIFILCCLFLGSSNIYKVVSSWFSKLCVTALTKLWLFALNKTSLSLIRALFQFALLCVPTLCPKMFSIYILLNFRYFYIIISELKRCSFKRTNHFNDVSCKTPLLTYQVLIHELKILCLQWLNSEWRKNVHISYNESPSEICFCLLLTFPSEKWWRVNGVISR